MRIAIVGGGPAGLYFAILAKKSDPSREITVWEKNAPGDTFGWGVVFSGKTLSSLQQADPESHRDITRSFVTWEHVEIRRPNFRVRIGGNEFAGIARLELLRILQNRCRDLEVELRFQTEAPSPRQLMEYDLLMGADGVGSGVRTAFVSHFQPELGYGRNRYIWYGTPQPFNGLTLIFRPTEKGVFAAHSYKFSKELSTFIIECDDETWRESGFEEMSAEQTMRLLEKVFKEDLGSHPLLSNNSRWIRFLNVKNHSWHYKNVALIGDALHTAHFSIGSGTKLALEDAIALNQSIEACHGQEQALEHFEVTRKQYIENYQAAAEESRVWFEKAREHLQLDEWSFALSLMTRSTKIDYEKLKGRDPDFIAAYEGAMNARQRKASAKYTQGRE